MDKDNGNGLLAACRILFDSNTSLTVSVQVQLEGSGKYFSVLVLCKIKKCSGKFCRKQQFYFKIFCRCMGRFQDHILGLICWTESVTTQREHWNKNYVVSKGLRSPYSLLPSQRYLLNVLGTNSQFCPIKLHNALEICYENWSKLMLIDLKQHHAQLWLNTCDKKLHFTVNNENTHDVNDSYRKSMSPNHQ